MCYSEFERDVCVIVKKGCARKAFPLFFILIEAIAIQTPPFQLPRRTSDTSIDITRTKCRKDTKRDLIFEEGKFSTRESCSK